jgi:DNA transformation protein
VSADDPVYLRELFSAFGPVAIRRMFGGAGIFADGTMFALVADGAVYLKADDESVADFKRAGMPPFSYETGKGKRAVMSYWRMPDHLYDDPDDLAKWASNALAAARRKTSSGKSGKRAGAAAKARSRRKG